MLRITSNTLDNEPQHPAPDPIVHWLTKNRRFTWRTHSTRLNIVNLIYTANTVITDRYNTRYSNGDNWRRHWNFVFGHVYYKLTKQDNNKTTTITTRTLLTAGESCNDDRMGSWKKVRPLYTLRKNYQENMSTNNVALILRQLSSGLKKGPLGVKQDYATRIMPKLCNSTWN